MTIRLAKTEDIDSLMSITKSCISDLRSQGIDQWDEIYPSKNDFIKDIEDLSLYVISREGKVLGCICVNNIEHPGYENANWNGTHFCVIHKLMISPESSGNGLSKRLMESIEQDAKRKQLDSIRLDCFTQNTKANNLYLKADYIKRGEVIFRKGVFNLYEKTL